MLLQACLREMQILQDCGGLVFSPQFSPRPCGFCVYTEVSCYSTRKFACLELSVSANLSDLERLRHERARAAVAQLKNQGSLGLSRYPGREFQSLETPSHKESPRCSPCPKITHAGCRLQGWAFSPQTLCWQSRGDSRAADLWGGG